MEKYKDQNIIGHFGLGFYSAFIVAKKVELRTQSYKDDTKTIVWTCDGTPEYTLDVQTDNLRGRGTDVILHLADDSVEFCEEGRVADLRKILAALAVPLAFGKVKELERRQICGYRQGQHNQ